MAYAKLSKTLKITSKSKLCQNLMILAYEFCGVLKPHKVPTGERVNKEYYKKYIRTILRPALHRKRQELTDYTARILHENASPNKANVVKELLESCQWEVLDHPTPTHIHIHTQTHATTTTTTTTTYYPDLSPDPDHHHHPPDFDLFPKLKEALRGISYDNLDKKEYAVNGST